MTKLELKKLLGHKVRWEITHDRYRGTYSSYSGIATEIKGKNILIDGVWKWLPSLEGLRKDDTIHD